MIPAENIFQFKGRYFNKPKIFSFFDTARAKNPGKALFEGSAKGLSKKAIGLLKSAKLPFKTLKVQSSMPFAPFLFFGALLTILFQGNVIRILLLH